MRMPKPKENTEWWVKKQVREILDITGWKYWMPAAGVYGTNGISDFLCMKQPRLFMAIETKYDDVVTAQQFKFLTSVHDAGHYAFLVDETNIEELHALLSDFKDDYWGVASVFMKWQHQNPTVDISISKTS